MLLIGATLFGIKVLKNNLSSERNNLFSEKLVEEIKGVDSDIIKMFFKLGISEKNITDDKNNYLEKEGIKWIQNKKSVKLDRKINKNSLSGVLSGISGKGESKKFDYYIEDSPGGYTANIKINGFDTHKIIFKFSKPNIAAKKPGEKAEMPAEKKSTGKADDYDYVSKAPDGRKPRISIIVDDVGINKEYVDQLVNLSPNITFAILPNRPNSVYAAMKARERGIDIILHQPMEPKTSSGYNADDAGEGVLLVGQSKDKILNQLNSNLASVPNVIGVNNHMGSKFTENEELMRLVILNLKDKGLFFVDSLTTPQSVGYSIAKEEGVKAARRDVFLDNKKKGKSYVKSQLKKLISKAEKNGYAIGICHPYPQTIEALTEEIPKFNGKIEITPVKLLLN
jgi:polysaccharide deacetylase 2 family uncharacterized protein YibQ